MESRLGLSTFVLWLRAGARVWREPQRDRWSTSSGNTSTNPRERSAREGSRLRSAGRRSELLQSGPKRTNNKEAFREHPLDHPDRRPRARAARLLLARRLVTPRDT